MVKRTNSCRQAIYSTLVIFALGLVMGGCTANAPSTKPSRADATYAEGALALKNGDQDTAIKQLQAALVDNPDLIMARYLLGNIYRDREQFEKAADQYKRVTELDPYVWSNHYNLALMYHLLNRLQEAIASYAAALELNPGDFGSNINMALACTALGQGERGLPYAQRAVEIQPESPQGQANLGVVLDSLKRYPEAETAYRKSLELKSDQLETMLNLAANLVAQKRAREAINIYEQILKTNDGSPIRHRYGYALLREGRIDEAMKQFDRALILDPGNFIAFNGRGDVFYIQYRQDAGIDDSKKAAAVDAWKKSLAINPNQPRIKAQIKAALSSESLFP